MSGDQVIVSEVRDRQRQPTDAVLVFAGAAADAEAVAVALSSALGRQLAVTAGNAGKEPLACGG